MVNSISISDYLREQEIKISNSGYSYLHEAIRLRLESPLTYEKITVLYSELSKLYSKTPSSIERAIRYSLLNKSVSSKNFINRAFKELNQ